MVDVEADAIAASLDCLAFLGVEMFPQQSLAFSPDSSLCVCFNSALSLHFCNDIRRLPPASIATASCAALLAPPRAASLA